MSEASKRRKRGEKKIKEVYAGDVPIPPAGTSDFADIMLEQLFAEVVAVHFVAPPEGRPCSRA